MVHYVLYRDFPCQILFTLQHTSPHDEDGGDDDVDQDGDHDLGQDDIDDDDDDVVQTAEPFHTTMHFLVHSTTSPQYIVSPHT